MPKFLWVFDYDALYTLIPICGALWALGGSGMKILRRLGVPFIISLSALSIGIQWYWSFLCMVLFVFASLPYGSKIKEKIGVFYWPYLVLVGFLWGASLVGLAIASHEWTTWLLWSAICGLGFMGLTALSQWKKTANIVVWKFVEIAAGGMVGGAASFILINAIT